MCLDAHLFLEYSLFTLKVNIFISFGNLTFLSFQILCTHYVFAFLLKFKTHIRTSLFYLLLKLLSHFPSYLCLVDCRYVFYTLFLLLLSWGYIVTFTKFLTMYHSWTHPLGHSLLTPNPPPYSWNSFSRSHYSIFIPGYRIFLNLYSYSLVLPSVISNTL
jgi:hypothetical protein